MQLPDEINNPTLKKIAGKVMENIPVNQDDAFSMLTTDDIMELGAISNHIRTHLHGNTTYYSVNMNLNHTNICTLRCPLCAFSCDIDDKRAFLLSIDEIEKRVLKGVTDGIDEVHIVGGLHPDLTLDYFEEMLRKIKKIKAELLIVGFTAVEYDHFAKINRLSVEEVFRRLIDAGVDALPGGGAEIFSPQVRQLIAPNKITGKRWLSIMRTAHTMGLKTNATILYNHIENTADIVDHLFQIRNLQSETGGFKTFVPLQFHEKNTQVRSKRESSTGHDDIRIYAASRIVLDNIPHVKALWMYLGEKTAQVLQHFGVDDIGGTYMDEKVVHAAGARTSDYGTEVFLRRMIEESGMLPSRTTANYQNETYSASIVRERQ
jgi:aminodeoxyfutalosine synthase